MHVYILYGEKEKQLEIEKYLYEYDNENTKPIHTLDYSSDAFMNLSSEIRNLTYRQLATSIANTSKEFRGFNIIIRTNVDIDTAWNKDIEYLFNHIGAELIACDKDAISKKFFKNSIIKDKKEYTDIMMTYPYGRKN